MSCGKLKMLSDDLILEILSWLPATTLVRFILVCKSWFNLVTTSSRFIQSQLDGGSRIGNPSIFFYYKHDDQVLPSTMELKDNKNTQLLLQPSLVKTVVLPMMKNMVSDQPDVRLPVCVGSCNGLICFSLDLSSVECRYYLWNPSINEFIDIPILPPVNVPRVRHNALLLSWKGFGYDRVLADYKIINIFSFLNDDINNTRIVELMVYTLGTNSWRNAGRGLDISKLCFPTQDSGLELNGSLHWIGMNPQGYCLTSFDIADESVDEFPAPPGFSIMHCAYPAIRVLSNCLCVLHSCRDDWRVEVWMMKDYSLKESWVKLFSTRHPELRKNMAVDILNVLWICKNGEILMEIDKGYFLYNPKSDEVKFLESLSSSYSYIPRNSTKVYFPSLVHLKSGDIVQSKESARYAYQREKLRI